ncbi:MAG: 50S ribosomal protein L9 [Nitrospiraceae bacterium]|nr:MAG: 50S ribosomal protein L9 [Nitrospiraceae bacterium]
MKVILKEDVKNLGSMGTVVNVANGYGRNYLIPRNLAVEANPKNLKRFEHEKNIILEKTKKIKNKQEALANNISQISLTIEANAGEDGKLFGSVTSKDIAEEVAKQGIEIDKRKVVLPEETIKRIGTYTIQVKLHPEVTANIQLEVRPVENQEGSSG